MHVIFLTFLPELWPLINAKISFLFNIWRTNGQNFTKFYICLHIYMIYVGIVRHHFWHICTRVMAPDLRKYFVSAHYLENKLIEFHQILYAFILTRSTLGSLHIFRTFVPVLWPFIYVKISFPFTILRTDGQNFTKIYICISIDKIYFGIVTHHISHICTSVMALDLCENFVSVQYLWNKWTEFHQIVYMQLIDKIYAGIDTRYFCTHLYQSYGRRFNPKVCCCSMS